MVLQGDGVLWTHGTIVDKGDTSQNFGSYKIRVMKTRCIMIRNSRQPKMTTITAKQYLGDQILKINKTDIIQDILTTMRNKAGPIT